MDIFLEQVCFSCNLINIKLWSFKSITYVQQFIAFFQTILYLQYILKLIMHINSCLQIHRRRLRIPNFTYFHRWADHGNYQRVP